MCPETELKPLRGAFYPAMEDGEPLRVIISGEAGWPSPACGMCLTPAPSALPAGQAARRHRGRQPPNQGRSRRSEPDSPPGAAFSGAAGGERG